MKTSSAVITSLLVAIAAAAPLDRRARVTKTQVVVETVNVYTTVWQGETVPEATTSAAAFYEQKASSPKPSSAAAPTTSAYVAPPPKVSSVAPVAPVVSSVFVPPPPPSTTPQAPPPAPSTTEAPPPPPSTTQAPVKTTEAPAPQPTTAAPAPKPTSEAPAPPPPAASAPAPSPAPSNGGGSGEVHSGGSLTLNPFQGNLGACGDPIADTDMAVALAADTFGVATVDYMSGLTTNKFCNAKVAITYKGTTVNAVIKDKCPGCTNGGFDATPALWKALTGTDVGDRLMGMTWQFTS